MNLESRDNLRTSIQKGTYIRFLWLKVNMDVSKILPDFIDPLLAYLESILPGPVYAVLLTSCSHVLALSTALLSLLSSSPSTWTAQSIIPPIITILAAYLALSGIYRTIRFALWFAKWGTLLAALMGGVAWFMSGGVTSLLTQGGGGRTPKSSPSRLRAWDSWARHDEYRHQRPPQLQTGVDDMRKFVQELAGAAGRVYAQSGDWWATAKGVADEMGKHSRTGREDATESSGRKTRSKTGKTSGTR
jgi:hypothetical protein